MTQPIYILRAASIGLLLALAGCGDGGGGVASTPLPPAAPASTPVTPANLSPSTAFSNTMQSGNFVSITAGASSSFTSTDPAPTATANVTVFPQDTGGYVSYDATSNTYALNTTSSKWGAGTSANGKLPLYLNGLSPTQGTPDPTEVEDSRVQRGGSFSNVVSVEVTHTGSGPFVYTYTAFASYGETNGFVGKTNNSDTLVAVFGMPTPASAIPRTGSATYGLDLLGTYTGTGTGTVNFAAGSYDFSGTLKDTGPAGGTLSGTFKSTGTLASASNGFSGTVDVSVSQTIGSSATSTSYRGSIGGLFFGPSAQELGGTFVAPATSSITYQSQTPAYVAGAILGHR